MLDFLSRTSSEPKFTDRTRRTTPKDTEELVSFFKLHDAPNGHVYRKYTQHRGHAYLPTQEFYKCTKCGMYSCEMLPSRGGLRSRFFDRCREMSCLEHAYREFRSRNRVRGKQDIEQVCEDEGIVEAHQFAEGIGVPNSPYTRLKV